MRVSRDELRFDFGGARFRLPRDRALLGWIVDQFLYGEVTGIQVGHWLYGAPSLEAATFFARQAARASSPAGRGCGGRRPGRLIRWCASSPPGRWAPTTPSTS